MPDKFSSLNALSLYRVRSEVIGRTIIIGFTHLLTHFVILEVATCDEIAECILWTEGACTAEGSREVCFKTGNSETTGLGDCTLGDGEFIDGACFVADVTNPGGKSFLSGSLNSSRGYHGARLLRGCTAGY